MSKQLTAAYFINKFMQTDPQKWITGRYTRGDRHCVLGWGSPSASSNVGRQEANSLDRLCEAWLGVSTAAVINDGIRGCNWADSPYERIMVALENIRQAGG